MTSLKSEHQEINIEKIAKSETFNDFKSEIIQLNEPYMLRLDSITSDELNDLISNYKNAASSDEYSTLVKEMGYLSIEDYEDRMSSMFDILNKLIIEFPEIENASIDEREDAFEKLFTKQFINTQKSVGHSENCTYNLSYCLSMAKGYYYARTAACATPLVAGPMGGFAAAACQIGNTALYEGAKMECAHEYDQCTS